MLSLLRFFIKLKGPEMLIYGFAFISQSMGAGLENQWGQKINGKSMGSESLIFGCDPFYKKLQLQVLQFRVAR